MLLKNASLLERHCENVSRYSNYEMSISKG